MKILFYDTETTGLILKDNFPYIVQFSYIIYDTELNCIIFKYDEIIHLPESIEIPEESTKIHHISTLMSRQSIVEILDCLKEFIEHCKTVDLVVGHNISFDNQMVIGELKRQNQDVLIENFSNLNFYCTMKETIKFCNISATTKMLSRTYIKYPKLIELHDKLFGENITLQLHNSFNDVLVCFKCYFKFRHDIDINLTEIMI
jgi:DNA polymerase III epsilon subunit-like protein